MAFLEQVKRDLFYLYGVRLRKIKCRVTGIFSVFGAVRLAGLGDADRDFFGVCGVWLRSWSGYARKLALTPTSRWVPS
jgi:hypothetical protein